MLNKILRTLTHTFEQNILVVYVTGASYVNRSSFWSSQTKKNMLK